MQRIATLTAVAVVAAAAVVAFSGTFELAPEALGAATSDARGGASAGESPAMGRNSAGLLAGAFIGAAVALLSHTLVATALKLSTEAAFKALIAGFFAKCLGAILPWGALTFLPQVGRLADPTAYLVAFAIVVVLVLGGGLFDHLRAMADGSLTGDGSQVAPAAVPAAVPAAGNKSLTEIEGESSDQRSGSASSLPRKSAEGSLRSPHAASASSPVHPLGSSDSLESAT